MAEKTIILDGSNPQKEKEIKTQVMQQKSFQQEIVEISNHEKKKYNGLKIAGGVLAGGAAALVLMSFTPAPEEVKEEINNSAVLLPKDPEKAVTVNDQMSFSEAFETAREEAGPGAYFMWHGKPYSTYYSEEWNQLTNEEQNDFYNNIVENNDLNSSHDNSIQEPVVIYDNAPVSVLVDDEMSFNDAFAIAREEVGPGGVFQWNGRDYSTFTKEEWHTMDSDDRFAYQDSIKNVDTNNDFVYEHDGVLASNEITINEYPNNEEIFLGEQTIENEYGQLVKVGVFENNGNQEIRIDADNNGSYDYLYHPESDTISNIDTGEVLINNDNSGQSFALDTNTPISTEEVAIDGHTAWVTTFGDGRIEANVDVDGDGVGDSIMHMDTQGNMQLFDNNGQIIHEEQIDMNSFSNDDNYASLDPNSSDIGYLSMKSNENTENEINTDPSDPIETEDNPIIEDPNAYSGFAGDNPIMEDPIANANFDENYYPDDSNQAVDPGFDNNVEMGEWT